MVRANWTLPRHDMASQQGRPSQPPATEGETEAQLNDFNKVEQLTLRARMRTWHQNPITYSALLISHRVKHFSVSLATVVLFLWTLANLFFCVEKQPSAFWMFWHYTLVPRFTHHPQPLLPQPNPATHPSPHTSSVTRQVSPLYIAKILNWFHLSLLEITQNALEFN